MNIKLIISISLFAFILNFTYGQEYCGTKELDNNWINYYHNNKALFSQEDGKTIYAPIQLNILRKDDGKGEVSFMLLYRTLSKLNSDFEQVGVQFYLFKDFIKINKTAWYNHEEFSGGAQMMQSNNVQNAINCYIVKNPAGNCGYYSPRQDGLALGMGCMGGSSSTWTHEMGHLLTLPHTFYGCEGERFEINTDVNQFQNKIWGTLEKVDGSNCSTVADRFCDTKPDYLSYRWSCNNDGESSFLQNDINGKPFRSNGKLFMSYSNDMCTEIFSNEQIQAMRANLNGRRSSILKDTTPQVRDLAGDIELEMITPINNEKINFQNIILEWKEIDQASHYYVEISRRKSFNASNTIRRIVTQAAIEIDELLLDRKYYMRVLPFNLSAFNQNFLAVTTFQTGDLTSIQNADDIHISMPSLILQGENLIVSGIPTEFQKLSYTINNIAGQNVIKGRFKQTESIPTHQLQRGVYIIKLKTEFRDLVTKKLLIE